MATPLFGFTATGTIGYNQQIPSDITGLVIWLDSSDASTLVLSGTNVFSWTDKASSRILTPTTASTYPTRTNSTTGINFPNGGSGTGTYGLGYSTTWYLPTQNFSIFVVYKPTASASFNAAFGLTTSNNLALSGRPNLFCVVEYGTSDSTSVALDYDGSAFASVVTSASNGGVGLNAIHVDEIVMTTSSSTTKIYTNGTENTYSTGPASYTSSYTNYPVGYVAVAAYATAWGARSFTGIVYESIVYNRTVTASERANLENYFYLKWRFAPNQYTSNVYWFDAADTSTITSSGSAVTAWVSKGTATMTYSSNAGVVTTGTSTLNGRNVLSFPTSSSLISQSINLAITGNDETIFLVYQKRQNMTTSGQINLMTENNPRPALNPNNFSCYYNQIAYGKDLTNNLSNYDMFWTVCGGYCFTAEGNTPTYSPYVYQLLTLQVSTGANQGFWSFGGNNNGFGSGPGQFLNGCGYGYDTQYAATFNMGQSTVDWDIGEYIVYNRVLTTTERQNVEGYLSIKWGIPLVPSHPYSTKPAAANTFSPTSISGSILWLDAADTGTFTGGTTWTDKSGTTNTGINGTSGASTMPSVTNWYNGLQSARFVTGSKNSVKTTNNIPSYNLTIFYVTRIQAAPGYGQFFIDNYAGQRQLFMNTSSFPVTVYTFMNSSGGNLAVGSVNQSVPFLYSGTLNSSTYTYYFNGAQVGTGSVNSGEGASQYYFGSGNGDANYLTIDVGEIIIYNSVLSDTNRRAVETYLMSKWGIPK